MTEEELYAEFQKQKQASKPSDEELYQKFLASKNTVVDEMHPDIKMSSRFIFKNLTGNPEAGMQYLQKQNPGLEFKRDERGDVLAKRPDETAWKKLDPSGFDMQDISDIAVDVPKAFVDSAATALGGIGGAIVGAPTVVGAPVAALAGAGAAGAGTSAATEYARQKLGELAGLEDNVNTDDIKTEAAFGAASPLLFGTGAGVKQVGKSLLTQGMKAGEKEAIQSAQSGLVSRGLSGAKNKFSSMASGFTPEVIAQLPKKLPTLKAFEEGAVSQTDYVTDIGQRLDEAVMGAKEKAKTDFGAALEGFNKPIRLDDVNNPLEQVLTKYQNKVRNLRGQLVKKYGTDEESLQMIDGLIQKNDAFKNYQYVKDKVEGSVLPLDAAKGRQAIDYKDTLNDLTGLRMSDKTLKQSSVDRDLANAATQAVTTLDKRIKDAGSDRNLRGVYKQYAEVASDNEVLNKMFKTDGALNPEKIDTSLKQFASPAKKIKGETLTNLSKKYGAGIERDLEDDYFIRNFANPSLNPIHVLGQNTTQYSVPISAGAGYIASEYGRENDMSPMGRMALGLGAAVGAKGVFSPAGLKAQARVYRALNQGDEFLQNQLPFLPQAPLQQGLGIYQNLQQNER